MSLSYVVIAKGKGGKNWWFNKQFDLAVMFGVRPNLFRKVSPIGLNLGAVLN